MNLVLDLGNTQGKLALFNGPELLELTRLQPADLFKGVQSALQEHQGIKAAIISSVVNHPEQLEAVLAQHCALTVLNPSTPLPITNSYATPATLGRDRLAAAVAAHTRWPGQNVLSIDAGTCITFDLLTSDGSYQGGAISPGIAMRFKALHTFTEHLPLIPGVPQNSGTQLVGTTTEQSIQSGVLNGVAAEVQGIVDVYRAQYKGLNVVLTGGDLPFFEKALKNPIFAAPNLVLEGLNSILSFNDRKDHS